MFMRAAPGLLAFFSCLVTAALASVASPPAPARLTWETVEFEYAAREVHPWWAFPVQAEFSPERGGERITVAGFWVGENRWRIRFAAAAPGRWTFRTRSTDAGLDGHTGVVEARAPTAGELAANPNRRGAIRVRPAQRHLEYADGTPFFLLADTLWAANTARCGLGAADDGPFFQYLADRQAKGFTAILLKYFDGYGDYPDAPGHRNEGGKIFFAEHDPQRLNPAFFDALDRRLHALADRGLVAAVPTTWWGKTRRNRFTLEEARRVTAYCAVRYGTVNALWCVTGEYQYVFADCGWSAADLGTLGTTLQQHNPWRRPVSIHPSSRTNFPAPHNTQSSRPFHGEPWLDHHWLQTGQSRDRMHHIVQRLADDRALTPALPVFCSESFYETAEDADGAYHARWQAWTAFLNGAAGYGYGADGIWQFRDPNDPHGETGKLVKGSLPWQQALAFPGSSQLKPVRTLLTALRWWELEPARNRIRVDRAVNPAPDPKEIWPPHVALSAEAGVIYLPRGNAARALELALPAGRWSARWYDPRNGEFVGEASPVHAERPWPLPTRPTPAEEDWVLLLRLER